MKEFNGVAGGIARFIERNFTAYDKLHLLVKETERLQGFLKPYVNGGRVTLNISPIATNDTLGYDESGLWFKATFGGKHEDIYVVWADVIAVVGIVNSALGVHLQVFPEGVTIAYMDQADHLALNKPVIKEETKRPKLSIVKND